MTSGREEVLVMLMLLARLLKIESLSIVTGQQPEVLSCATPVWALAVPRVRPVLRGSHAAGGPMRMGRYLAKKGLVAGMDAHI